MFWNGLPEDMNATLPARDFSLQLIIVEPENQQSFHMLDILDIHKEAICQELLSTNPSQFRYQNIH